MNMHRRPIWFERHGADVDLQPIAIPQYEPVRQIGSAVVSREPRVSHRQFRSVQVIEGKDKVHIFMPTGLSPEQRVDCPAPIEPSRHTALFEQPNNSDDFLSCARHLRQDSRYG
jgi:hypothetical protein